MSQMFGVSTDYLLKDEEEEADYVDSDEPANGARRVSLKEANEFLALREKTAVQLALGVALCILSPVLLIFLGGLSELPQVGLTEDAAVGIGMVVLFIIIAIAVAVFIVEDNQMKPYEYLKKEVVELEYGVRGVVTEREKAYQAVYNRKLIIGCVLCILSVTPLFIMVIFDPIDMYYILALMILLFIVAVGAFILVDACTIKSSFQQLLQEGDYTKENKHANRYLSIIGSVYWTIITAAYLGISFLTERWDISWIIWPVAGVLYGAIAAIFHIVQESRKNI